MDRWLEKDVTIRILAVVLAVAMWFQVTNEQNPLVSRTFRSVPIVIENMDESLVIMELVPETISATVQGQRKTVGALKDEDMVAYVDIKGIEAGRRAFTVRVVPPRSVEVTQTQPSEVSVTTEMSAQKKVRVDVRALGVPAEEYLVSGGQADTAEVDVVGALSLVNLVSRVVADVDVTDASEDIAVQVALRALDVAGKDIDGVSVVPGTVLASVAMRKLPPSKTVEVSVDIEGAPREGYIVKSVATEPGTVLVRGPNEVLNSVESVITQKLDVHGIASSFDRQIDLVLPPGISTVEPSSVLATVFIAEDLTQAEFSKTVSVVGLDSSLRATLSVTEAALTVTGRRQIVESLTAKDISAEVDLSGLTEGEHDVSIVVSLPDDVASVEVRPATLGVQIKKK